MKFAKSMYLGGDLVSPTECDRDSYKEFGLTCPFCSNAVFLRAESIRSLKNDRITIIPATFSHFPNVANLDCEAYSITSAGLQELQKHREQAKSQRLVIYQNNLWNIITANKNSVMLEGALDASVNYQKYTNKSKHSAINEAMLAFDRNFKIYLNTPNLKDWSMNFIKAVKNTSNKSLMTDKNPAQFHISVVKYFNNCDLELHYEITLEILEFLSTRSGNKILKTLLIYFIALPKRMDASALFDAIFYFVVSTPLLEVFKK